MGIIRIRNAAVAGIVFFCGWTLPGVAVAEEEAAEEKEEETASSSRATEAHREALRQAHEERLARLERSLEVAEERERDDMKEEIEERIEAEKTRFQEQLALLDSVAGEADEEDESGGEDESG